MNGSRKKLGVSEEKVAVPPPAGPPAAAAAATAAESYGPVSVYGVGAGGAGTGGAAAAGTATCPSLSSSPPMYACVCVGGLWLWVGGWAMEGVCRHRRGHVTLALLGLLGCLPPPLLWSPPPSGMWEHGEGGGDFDVGLVMVVDASVDGCVGGGEG